MKRVCIVLLILWYLWLSPGLAETSRQKSESFNPIRYLSDAQRIELARLLYSFEPFLETAVDVDFPHTLNHLLDPSVYQKLKGNPFIGYIYDEGAGSIAGAAVALEIRSASYTLKYLPVFRQILERANHNRPAPEPHRQFSLTVCLVDVTTGPVPAVTLEAVASDGASGKRMFIRASTGYHRGLYEAMDLASRRLFLSLDYMGRRP